MFGPVAAAGTHNALTVGEPRSRWIWGATMTGFGTTEAANGELPHSAPSIPAQLTCENTGGRGRYRTADRWCVKPSPTVHRVSRGAIASWNAQFSGWFVSTLSTDCRAVFARLGTLLAQRGVWSSGVRSRLRGGLAFSLPGRTIHLLVELRELEPHPETCVNRL
jgi:hypothetical protein